MPSASLALEPGSLDLSCALGKAKLCHWFSTKWPLPCYHLSPLFHFFVCLYLFFRLVFSSVLLFTLPLLSRGTRSGRRSEGENYCGWKGRGVGWGHLLPDRSACLPAKDEVIPRGTFCLGVREPPRTSEAIPGGSGTWTLLGISSISFLAVSAFLTTNQCLECMPSKHQLPKLVLISYFWSFLPSQSS